jgi:hypothetical protein
VLRFVESNQTVVLKKGNYEAVLSLNEHGEKKTWLLTGFDVTKPKESNKKPPVGDSKFSPRHAPTQSGPMFSRPELGADGSLRDIISKLCGSSMKKTSDTLTFDATTLRRKDENGFLHVAVSHISKETVNSYRGREIPGWPDLGLDPNQIYQGYRCQVK